MSGESGGGNLTLATAIKAKRDGRLDHIDGIYAQCPYISGMWDAPPPELPSLVENNDYFIGCGIMAIMAAAYDPIAPIAPTRSPGRTSPPPTTSAACRPPRCR